MPAPMLKKIDIPYIVVIYVTISYDYIELAFLAVKMSAVATDFVIFSAHVSPPASLYANAI